MVLLTGCGAGSGGGGGRKAQGSVPPDFLGVNANLLFQLVLHDQLPTLDRQLDGVAKTGVSYVRAPPNWANVEPVPVSKQTPLDFSTTDTFVSALAERGLSWHLLEQGTPAWAADPGAYAFCSFRSAPRRPEFVAVYLTALARRYGRDGSFWSQHPDLPYRPVTTYEIGNEPNLAAFWCPRPDPAAYASTFVLAAKLVRAVDPKATIEVGGLAPIPATQPPDGPPQRVAVAEFLTAAVRAEPSLPRLADAVAVHPYAATPGDAMDVLAGFRTLLRNNGMGDVPMDVDEVGWSTVATPTLPPTPESTRSRYIQDVVEGIAQARERLNILALSPYAWTTPQLNPAQPNDWYGMADPVTGAPYPSGKAFASTVRALTGAG